MVCSVAGSVVGSLFCHRLLLVRMRILHPVSSVGILCVVVIETCEIVDALSGLPLCSAAVLDFWSFHFLLHAIFRMYCAVRLQHGCPCDRFLLQRLAFWDC